MSVFNLGVVFGPTLLRPTEDTIASILDIKFNNVVIELLIENYDVIFLQKPVTGSEYSEYINDNSYRRLSSNSVHPPVMRVCVEEI